MSKAMYLIRKDKKVQSFQFQPTLRLCINKKLRLRLSVESVLPTYRAAQQTLGDLMVLSIYRNVCPMT